MPIHQFQDISFITSELLDAYKVKHGFFMRHGGCSPYPWKSLNMATSVGDSRENVIENRKRVADSLQIARSSFYDLWQVHSNDVVVAEKPRPKDEPHIQADAVVSNKLNVALLMQFADCVPMLFFDPEQNVIASAHAGWKGTLSGIAGETIKMMAGKYECEPENIIAVIGPSICRDHYQIGEDVALKVKKVYAPNDNVLNIVNKKIYLDLVAANKNILEKYGLLKIDIMNICTFCDKEDWFSHRGESGKTGRFASVVTL
jgi:YfiH family protein